MDYSIMWMLHLFWTCRTCRNVMRNSWLDSNTIFLNDCSCSKYILIFYQVKHLESYITCFLLGDSKIKFHRCKNCQNSTIIKIWIDFYWIWNAKLKMYLCILLKRNLTVFVEPGNRMFRAMVCLMLHRVFTS